MAMDFFDRQDHARRQTTRLVVLFGFSVAAIIAAIYLVLALALASSSDFVYVDRNVSHDVYSHRFERNEFAAIPRDHRIAKSQSLWQPDLLLWVTVGTLTVVLLGSLYKMSELSAGGETVALMLGGRAVDPQTRDLAERRLLNIVEEMALASGVPVPPVFILDQEPSINAFAAGHQPGDAVVAVSQGALTYLNRDELQGVIGHEFSHILNGDMRLNLRLMGIVYGILVLAIVGYYVMQMGGSVRTSRDDGKNNGLPLVLIGIVLLLFGYLGVFFGRLIQSAINRQREYLADASAVQFTRQPGGIAGALKKIGGLSEGSQIRNAHAQEASHMFFGDAFCNSFFNLFATHPPLADRIRAIDATFDGVFPEVTPVSLDREDMARESSRSRRPTVASGMMGLAGAAVAAAATQNATPTEQMTEQPAEDSNAAASDEAEEARPVSSLIAGVPQPLIDAAREPFAAQAIVYLLLLDREQEAIQAKQLALLRARLEPPLFAMLDRMAATVQTVPVAARLPLVDLTIPALKRASAQQYARFRQTVDALVNADQRVNLFEYSLCSVLFNYLDVHFGLKKPASPRYRAIAAVSGPMQVALSMLAYVGQSDEASATKAFQAGADQRFGRLTMIPLGECTLQRFDAALAELAQTTPIIKRTILEAVTACITADGKVTPDEQALLRVIAAALSCPTPPIA